MRIYNRCGLRFLRIVEVLGKDNFLEIIDYLWNRFIEVAILLHTFNLVREESIAYGLDQDSYNIETLRERLLKRKFLDSFAFICATKRDGDNVSIACLEEELSQETIVWITSNFKVRENTLDQLRELVNVLNRVASKDIFLFLLYYYEKVYILYWYDCW